MDEIDALGEHLSHISELIVILILCVCGISSFICRFLPNPIVSIKHPDGTTHQYIHGGYVYYVFYKILNILGNNGGNAKNLPREEADLNKISKIVGFVGTLADSGIFGKKIQTFCKEAVVLDKKLVPMIDQDLKEGNKILSELEPVENQLESELKEKK